jgi:putative spermidine/putrescine transport system substrate-binding protein
MKFASVTFISVVTAAVLAAVTLAPQPAAAQQKSDITLRVGNYGGRFTETQKRYAAERFTQNTGVKVQFIDANPLDHIAKLVAARGRNVPYDVIYIDGDLQPDAIKAGIVQPVDPAVVSNLKNLYPQALNKDGYGPGMIFYSFGILYNAEKYKEAGIPAPTSWADLWDPRLAGKIAIGELSHGAGRALLIQAERLAGGDETTPEKGIDKIAEIKAHSYFSSTVQLEALFPTNEIWVSVIASGRGWGLIDKGYPYKFVIPKEGAVASVTTLEVVKGTEHPKEANAFINYVLDPPAQIGQAWEIPYGPTNKTVAPVVAAYPDLARKLPGTEAEIEALYTPNWVAYWANHEKAVDLWARKVVRK